VEDERNDNVMFHTTSCGCEQFSKRIIVVQ